MQKKTDNKLLYREDKIKEGGRGGRGEERGRGDWK
jgi:hypothetical protein